MYIILLMTALIFANLPLITFKKSRLNQKKFSSIIWLIWFLAYFALIAIAYFLEQNHTGKTQDQTWEFYSITFLIYLIFSYPALMKQLFLMLKKKNTDA
jgi:hypothetical protein